MPSRFMPFRFIPFRALLLAGAALVTLVAPAPALTADDINSATFQSKTTAKGLDPRIVKAQTLLDRGGVSPGVIDGHDGENFRKAVAALRRRDKIAGEGFDVNVWKALKGDETKDIVAEIALSKDDAAYAFEKNPEDYAEKAKMKALAYETRAEQIGERFHMDDDLVRALNPKIEEAREGDKLIVTQTGERLKGKVARIVADKGDGMVVTMDEKGGWISAYPATIGSESTPTPSGKMEVTAVAMNPTYSYDPEKNFQQGRNKEKLTLPPGPNGPVGDVWIDLSKPTFGIHGTPEPSKVSKSSSHGCIRLTNWDAQELAKMVAKGTPVEIVD